MSSKRDKALAVTATAFTLVTVIASGLLLVMVAWNVVSDVAACMSDPECFRFGMVGCAVTQCLYA